MATIIGCSVAFVGYATSTTPRHEYYSLAGTHRRPALAATTLDALSDSDHLVIITFQCSASSSSSKSCVVMELEKNATKGHCDSRCKYRREAAEARTYHWVEFHHEKWGFILAATAFQRGQSLRWGVPLFLGIPIMADHRLLGFNQPIMCGGEPRVMTRKERGSLCEPIYAIKINVPLHALTLEFSFTDGTNWDGPYKLIMELPAKLKGLPQSYFDKGLAKELAHEGACETAIYPEAVFVQDRCAFPAGMIQQGGDRCDLDIVPGCTDPESPVFDPLANVDDGSCPYISHGEN